MCSFITQHNATDVASFEGSVQLAWWLQECPPELFPVNLMLIYLPKAFQRIWQCIQPASQPQTTCNHTSPGPPHPASSPPRSSETSHPDSCCNNRFALPKNFCTNCQKPSQGSSSAARRPHRGLDLTAVHRRNRLEWANAYIRWRLALWRRVLFSDEYRFSLYRADGRQRVWRRVGERFADVNVVDRVAHGGGGVMVWAGICYGQRTQVHSIDGILNAQRYRDEILRPIVVPFIHDHHLMLQHDNAQPHVARICTQFLEAENIPVLAWPAYSPDMDRHIRLRVPVLANIQQLHTAIEEEWTNITQLQSTTWSTLCEGDVLHCVLHKWWSHQILTGFWTPPNTVKLHILEWPFIVASLRHTCAIIMLFNHHLDIPHLWGGWII